MGRNENGFQFHQKIIRYSPIAVLFFFNRQIYFHTDRKTISCRMANHLDKRLTLDKFNVILEIFFNMY